MDKKLNREEAIALVGLEAVNKIDNAACYPTSRLLPDNMQDVWEYEACITVDDNDYDFLHAYYYPAKDDFYAKKYYPQAGEDEMLEDESLINWQIAFYTVE